MYGCNKTLDRAEFKIFTENNMDLTRSEQYPHTAAHLLSFIEYENYDDWEGLTRAHKQDVFSIFLSECKDTFLDIISLDKIKNKLIKLVETPVCDSMILVAAHDLYYALYLYLSDERKDLFEEIFDEQKELYLQKLTREIHLEDEVSYLDCVNS